jgi:hypothetical protein
LRGKVHWTADDPTVPPGPVTPPPGLWEPEPGTTPSSGSYIYLESQPGEYVGAGGRYTYTKANAVLYVSTIGAQLSLAIEGDEDWSGTFSGMNSITQLQPGYYGDLTRNPTEGGLSWSGEGRGCNQAYGWFVVDDVVYSGTKLVSIDLRFEQYCDINLNALHGKIHWEAGDTTVPPGPTAPPSGLWAPPANATPATGNYVYLESQPGDYVGQGGTYLYTQADSTINAQANGAHLGVWVTGSKTWFGDFQVMSTLTKFEVGYYGDLPRYPLNTATGGLDWAGDGRGCNRVRGWFVVDGVTYSGTAMTSIDLRFEQHCEGAVPALRGKIHWSL